MELTALLILTPERCCDMEGHPDSCHEGSIAMRVTTLLLGVILLGLSGCAGLTKHQEEPKPDYKPNEPTREMMF